MVYGLEKFKEYFEGFKDQFYRFSKPNRTGYPAMIELFSRESDDFKLKFENGLTPIHIDESVASLSAIL
jgi:hypothetical protein